MRYISFITGLYLVLAGGLCHAQDSDIYLNAVINTGLLNTYRQYDGYDIEIVSNNYSQKRHFFRDKSSNIYHNVPQGTISIKISDTGFKGVKEFSDSIMVHKGINAVIVEMDYSGEQKMTFKDKNDLPAPFPPEWIEGFGIQADGTIYVAKPSRPKMVTIDGKRALGSEVFTRMLGYEDPAIEVMEKNGWAKLYSSPDGPVSHALILLDPDVHWSWKNGAYVFWKDEEN